MVIGNHTASGSTNYLKQWGTTCWYSDYGHHIADVVFNVTFSENYSKINSGSAKYYTDYNKLVFTVPFVDKDPKYANWNERALVNSITRDTVCKGDTSNETNKNEQPKPRKKYTNFRRFWDRFSRFRINSFFGN